MLYKVMSDDKIHAVGRNIAEKATKIGYEIPMTRYFYKYQPPEPAEDIAARITSLETDIANTLKSLFHKED